MAVQLDISSFPVADRVKAFEARLDAALPPSAQLDAAQEAQGSLSGWDLGSEAVLADMRVTARYLQLSRRKRSPPFTSSGERLSVSVNPVGDCRTDGRGVQASGRRLRLLDLTSDFSVRYRGSCRSVAFDSDNAYPGLSVDAVRAAVGRTDASPLHDLVRRHLIGLADSAHGLTAETLLTTGAATADLVRALVQSVSSRDADRAGALAETLPIRIDDYIRRHLGDSDLSPARIAEAHHVSLRYLYVLLADRAETPAEWIMRCRLAAAHADLARDSPAVGVVAQRWGFKDQSHFTRRFKAAYGITPGEFARTSSNPS
jgi:AraC-like DNA-binding protein